LAYGILSLARSFLGDQAGFGPEASLARMSQFLSLYPILFLGPVLIFAPQGASKDKGLWRNLTSWLVLFLAIMFLIFTPLSFYNQFSLTQRDANQVKRLEDLLQRRKQEILGSVQSLDNPAEFPKALSKFPEIRSANIVANQSPTEIRKAIGDGIDRGIKAEVGRLREQQKLRMIAVSSAVRGVAATSLLAGLTFLLLAGYLLPWFAPARHLLGAFNQSQVSSSELFYSQMRRATRSRQLASLLEPVRAMFVRSGPGPHGRSSWRGRQR
jgi:hypothetical protein